MFIYKYSNLCKFIWSLIHVPVRLAVPRLSMMPFVNKVFILQPKYNYLLVQVILKTIVKLSENADEQVVVFMVFK